MAKKQTNEMMEENLKNELNNFFKDFGCDDIFENMTTEKFINLKQILSCINNIITLRVTKAFVEKLKNDAFISGTQNEEMLTKILSTNPNSNGYDVSYDGKLGNEKFIAEVKCNIPINEDSFGNKQIEGITKDINNLFNGKESTNETKKIKDELGDYYKFFVIMTCESKEKLKRDNIRDCMDKIINPINDQNIYCGKEILYYEDYKKDLKTNNVYVVFVSID